MAIYYTTKLRNLTEWSIEFRFRSGERFPVPVLSPGETRLLGANIILGHLIDALEYRCPEDHRNISVIFDNQITGIELDLRDLLRYVRLDFSCTVKPGVSRLLFVDCVRETARDYFLRLWCCGLVSDKIWGGRKSTRIGTAVVTPATNLSEAVEEHGSPQHGGTAASFTS